MLGGKLINEGILPYRDYFSHHMPLPYYLAAVINKISGPNPLNFRYVYLIFLYGWLLLFHKNLRTFTTPKLSLLFVILITLVNPVIWSHMLFAETLIGYASIHLSLLFLKIHKERQKPKIGDIFQISLIGCIPVLSSLGFWGLSAFYYLFFLIYYLRYLFNSSRRGYINIFRFISIYCLSVALPFCIMALFFIGTHSLNDFYLYNFIFNQEYYSIYTNDIPINNTQIFIDIFKGIFNSFAIDVQQLFQQPYTLHRLSFRIFTYSYIGLCFITKKKAEGIFFLISYFFLNVRQGDINIVNNIHEIQTMLFSILTIILFLGLFKTPVKLEGMFIHLRKYLFSLNVTLLVLLVGFLFGFDRDVLAKYRDDIMPTVVQEETELNKVLNSSGASSVWIGPSKFDEFFFLKPKVASKYYYWYPWLNSCSTCRIELVQDLEKNKPEIVYWDNSVLIWADYWSSDYGSIIVNFLKENYETDNNLVYRLRE